MGARRGIGGLALAAIPLLAGACAGGDGQGETPVEEATVEDRSGEAIAARPGLVNPNLATGEELAGVSGMTADAVAALERARPLLAMADVHGALVAQVGEDAARAAYEELWLPIDLNAATRDEILLVPGVGDRMAHEFEEYRPFPDLETFRREIGKYVDEDEVARLERYVFLPIDLNAATRDEIMGVPGMTDRMAYEFEEYRPYADLGRFRREIGKYVDEDEVARLERYVALN